jgi:hypothetical protein
MNHENKFSVSRFRNRNGVFSFRVDGQSQRRPHPPQLQDQEEAAAEKAALELKSLQIGSNLQAVIGHAEDQHGPRLRHHPKINQPYFPALRSTHFPCSSLS